MIATLWVRDLILFVVGCLIAYLGGQFLGAPFSTIAYVVGGIMAVVAVILLVVHLLSGAAAGPRGPRGPAV